MDSIYHLVTRATWEAAGTGPYSAASLATEGFIHCSYENQLSQTANLFYKDATDLLVLRLDPAKLTSPVKVEPGLGQLFPHIYGPINREAVSEMRTVQRGAKGEWVF